MPYVDLPLITLELSTGRMIRASSLCIEETYAGVLEGYPSSITNDSLLANLPIRATKTILGPSSVHIIEPQRKAEVIPGFYRPAEFLQPYWVAAYFRSSHMNRGNHASDLILIWFQDKPFPIPSEDALAKLREVNWEQLARDFEIS